MDYTEAKNQADALSQRIGIYCKRIEIAGSIRRQKQSDIKDIELVCIPEWKPVVNMFGEADGTANNVLFDMWASQSNCEVQWIKPGVTESVPWKVNPLGKYWRGILPSGAKLDLFLTTKEAWGAIYLIRTGSADFSKAVMTHAKKINRPFEKGRLTIAGIPANTPEETDVFRLLGLRVIQPAGRIGWDDLQLEV